MDTLNSQKRIFDRLYANKHLLVLLVVNLTGCVSFNSDWHLQRQQGHVSYFTRQSENPSLPEFKATVVINAPRSKVMSFLMDFSNHPRWVFRCKSVSVISTRGYTEAYLYQITTLPIIRDRDMILHASIHREDQFNRVRIHLRSAPDYCIDNQDPDCTAINQASYVRIREAHGDFVLTQRGDQTTEVEWRQFVDPSGSLHHWLFRSFLAQTPINSLRNLKQLIEADH